MSKLSHEEWTRLMEQKRLEWELLLQERKAQQRKNLAETVRFYRLLRQMTMRDLSKASGCALDTIYRVEHQRGDVRMDTIDRLAVALGVDWGDLVTGVRPERPQDVPRAPIAPAAVAPRRAVAAPTAASPVADRRPSRAERRRKEREKRKKI